MTMLARLMLLGLLVLGVVVVWQDAEMHAEIHDVHRVKETMSSSGRLARLPPACRRGRASQGESGQETASQEVLTKRPVPYVTEFIEANLYLSHKGVNIYNTYTHGDNEKGHKVGWFVLDPGQGEDSAFEVRKLACWREDPDQPPFIKSLEDSPEEQARKLALWSQYRLNNGEDQHIKSILKEAIEKGLIPSRKEK